MARANRHYLALLFYLFTITSPYQAGEVTSNNPDSLLLLVEGESKAVRLFSNSCLSLAQKSGLKVSMVEKGEEPFNYRLTLKHEKKKFTELNCYKRDDTRVLFSLKRSYAKYSAGMIPLIASDFVEVLKEHIEFQLMQAKPQPSVVDNLHSPYPGTNKIYKVGDEVSSLKVISRVEPTYTEKAREAGLLRVVQPLGLGLTDNAQDVMRLWKLKPAMRAGEPVDVELKIEVNFSLK